MSYLRSCMRRCWRFGPSPDRRRRSPSPDQLLNLAMRKSLENAIIAWLRAKLGIE